MVTKTMTRFDYHGLTYEQAEKFKAQVAAVKKHDRAIDKKIDALSTDLPREEFDRTLDALFAQRYGMEALWDIRKEMMETRMRNIREKWGIPMEA